MNIALDYDGTYTADSTLWDRFVADAKERGHKVWIVTCRRDTDENREDIGRPAGCLVLFTNLSAKRWALEQRGLRVDVWIDDDPDCVMRGK